MHSICSASSSQPRATSSNALFMDGLFVCAARFLASAALCLYSSDRDGMQGEHWKDASVPQIHRTFRQVRRWSGGHLCLPTNPVQMTSPESYIDPVMSNIVSGRQIRAARMLAGLTQADLARAAGCHPRSVRYWENKGSNPPTNVASTLDSIEQALNRHGVIPFSTPTPGVRCSN
jgi:DNA-binding transcriptional regulator YiaG